MKCGLSMNCESDREDYNRNVSQILRTVLLSSTELQPWNRVNERDVYCP